MFCLDAIGSKEVKTDKQESHSHMPGENYNFIRDM